MNDVPSRDAFSTDLTQLTAEIVSAYVAHNSLPAAELPAVLNSVRIALGGLGTTPATEQPKPDELKPAVPIKKSVTDDYLISLENGQKFKSLKRHLMTTYGMTPEQYREKWGLPKDYPMVAPAYAKSRSALAGPSSAAGEKGRPAEEGGCGRVADRGCRIVQQPAARRRTAVVALPSTRTMKIVSVSGDPTAQAI